jgi:hypothetical protein
MRTPLRHRFSFGEAQTLVMAALEPAVRWRPDNHCPLAKQKPRRAGLNK